MIPGVVGSSQYVLPLATVRSASFGGASAVAAPSPASDKNNYYAYNTNTNKVEVTNPFIANAYTDMADSTLQATTSTFNTITYENGRFFFTNFGNNRINTWVNPGDTISSITVTSTPRIIRWFPAMNAWVSIGNSGRVSTSTNGTTWTNRTAIGTLNLSAMATDGTTLVIAGGGGTMYSTVSTDPGSISWTTRTSSFGSTAIRSIEYKNGNWVATGSLGTVAYSTNGTSWTQKTTGAQTSGDSSDVMGAVYHMGRWVIVTSGTASSTNSYGIRSNTSDPSGSWTVVSSTLNSTTSRPFSDGKYVFWISDGGSMRYSR